jgi:hypothetical protein
MLKCSQLHTKDLERIWRLISLSEYFNHEMYIKFRELLVNYPKILMTRKVFIEYYVCCVKEQYIKVPYQNKR